jgi:hypothetical protein
MITDILITLAVLASWTALHATFTLIITIRCNHMI